MTMTPQQTWTPIPQDVSMTPVQRHLVLAYTALDRSTSRFIDSYGLTVPQFDVVVTLGDSTGMTCKQLAEDSLTTKGSLLPILDRLEGKGLVRRAKGEFDNRQTIVSLTDEGQALYQRVFPAFIAEMHRRVSGVMSSNEQQELVRLLGRLTEAYAS